MDTKLEVGCEFNNCTSVSSPGANIASPITSSLFGILGNAIALVTVHRMKLERHRTVFFVFIAGLAFADLVGIVLTTFPVLLVYSHGYYFGGPMMCNYHAFTMVTFGLLTPMIACAMAMERYFGIRHGYFYMLHFSPQRARMALLSLWLVAIIFSSLPMFGFGQYAIQYPGTWCFLNLHPETTIDATYSITFAVLNLLLIGIMIICNIGVQCTLVALRCQRSSADRADRFRRTHHSPQQEELEVQMMFVLLAITFVFTLCWTPLQFQILKNQFYEHKTALDHAGDLLAIRLASINQIIDPWVYILCKKLCFRRGCTCWRYVVQKTNWGSIKRSLSQKEFIGTSSLRSALVHLRAQQQPTRSASASRPCSRCRQKRVDVDLEVDAAETITLDEANHFSSSLSNAAICYDSTSKSTSLPINASPAPTAILIGGGSDGGTESSASHEIPIPIFTSSQYSIQRRRTRSTPRSSRKEERRNPIVNHTDTTAENKNRSAARVFSIDCEEKIPAIGRRRHSWCCSNGPFSTVGKRYVTQSTQTIDETQTNTPL
ncbi:prostaglandin E2 receptor EP3 subtype [Daphnia magna]|uniref:prostaglandin E2 receptor EP3 subtype n=1 Tax=Daphnia magna TaxID=35525 RepID=UPI001E1BAC0A|nr:prostaglandin E2 receptor EP3 subtype [Daphnia magna]XP_032780854.2 prostaglandin E2 receptor EP3 subtype [Daphnia magna]XP_045027311.1 prostaglandin E2 receptor EP3 subtype [Daphnia magna]